ncbi:hypothetical protein [Mesotoga sp. HF07.pep.5.2.highcov]|uniref:hypothetical protein n=1 Tax=Mesotoga sp. HF07.pep.5.2.highcov TaxID=1462923 RepID=UPI00217E4DE3|nr:hypothetical protein [Mesotoga sp. HF07.pep.5.2.highcov]
MKKFTLLLFFTLLATVFGSQGTLMFKGTDQYNLFLGRNLVDGRTLFTANTAIPEGFASVQVEQPTVKTAAGTDVFLRVTPQFMIHNFEPFKQKGGCSLLFLFI